MIRYQKGDATYPQGPGQKFIIHISNDRGGWGSGFVMAVSRRWRKPEQAYREWFKNKNHAEYGTFELGAVQSIQVESDVSVINMIAQRGYMSENSLDIPLSYDALEKCLNQVSIMALARNASVSGPRFGCGLAGGIWDKVRPIVQRTLADKGISVTIYDL